MRSVIIYYPSLNTIRVIKIKDYEICIASSTHGKDEKCIQNFDQIT